jgi:hypothetical protein
MHRIDVSSNIPTRRAGPPSSSPNASDPARTNKNVPVQIEFRHPLSWWRVRPAHAFKDLETARTNPQPTTLWRVRTAAEFYESDIAALADELRRITIRDERWALAREGHAAEAISMIVAEWPVSSVSPRIDAVMTAVTVAALVGSAAAALVVYHTTSQLASHLPEFRPLAASWLAIVRDLEGRRFSRRIAPSNRRLSKVVVSLNLLQAARDGLS